VLGRGRIGIGIAVAMVGAAGAAGAGGGDPDGKYRGDLTDEDGVRYGKVEFKVAKDGRLIKDFRTLVLSVCTNPNEIGGIEVIDVPVSFDRVEVKRSGRFKQNQTVVQLPEDSHQNFEVSGRLKSRRVAAGKLVLNGKCASTETFSARRTSGR
jgi:hypothetical protein